jgi:hypothetical protein
MGILVFVSCDFVGQGSVALGSGVLDKAAAVNGFCFTHMFSSEDFFALLAAI